MPTGYDLGVGCAVHSYNGKLFFGIIADTQAAPDVDKLLDFVVVSFQELRRSAVSKKVRNARIRMQVAEREQGSSAEPARAGAPESAEGEPPTVVAPAVIEKHTKEAA